MTLAVSPEDSESTLFGVSVSDMQSGITVSDDAIEGTLKFVDGGWDAGTWSEEESKGNYIALAVEADDGATVTVELVGGVHGPTTLDDDMNIVIRVTDEQTQTIRVISTLDGESVTKVFDLTGLTLEPEG